MNFKRDGSAHVLLLLQAILNCSKDLERLVLIDSTLKKKPVWNHYPSDMTDSVVNFALKMKRLVSFCLVLPKCESTLIDEVSEKIEEKVVSLRSSLWFHIGRYQPEATDVPLIHYHEMIEPTHYFPPPKF